MPLPTTIQTIKAPVEIAAAKDGENKAPTFSMLAYNGGLMRVAGWRFPVGVELSGITANQKTPIRAEHSKWQPVGHTEAVKIDKDARTVTAEGVISRDNEVSRDIVNSGKLGFPWQASIGLTNLQATLIQQGETATLNGQQMEGPFYHVSSARLDEISFVEHGADNKTSATVAATQTNTGDGNMPPKADPEGSTTEPQATQTPPVQAAAPAPTQPAPAAPAAPVGGLNLIEAAEAEVARRNDIEASAAKAIRAGGNASRIKDLMANALKDDNISAGSFEQEMILESRPSAAPRHGHASHDDRAIEAAMCLTAGLDKPEEHYPEQVLNAADDAFPHGLSLTEGLQIYAARNGFNGSTRDVEGLFDAAFARPATGIRAASTMSLPGILSNVANKHLVAGFNAVESAWQRIAAIRSVRDFKQHTSYTLTGDLKFEQVGPGGEIKHGKVGEETYTNQAKTYAKMFGVTREDIINDDLGALTAVPRRIGRGAALKLNDVFWTTFLDDAAIFTTENKNYKAGATTALSAGGLSIMKTLFNRQTDPDGNPLGVMPSILLVPTELEETARALMSSQLIVTGEDNTQPNSNVWRGRYEVVSSQYLPVDSVAWYLLARASELPLIEVAFLNGRRVPTVESAQANFSTLGIDMRGFFDFGVAYQEKRGGVKSKGKA